VAQPATSTITLPSKTVLLPVYVSDAAQKRVQVTYGPYSNDCVPLAVDAGNLAFLLWGSASTQQISRWHVRADGSFSNPSYAYPAGYAPVGLACGTGGDVRLLWSDGAGDAQVWTIAADGTYTAKTYSAVPAALGSLVFSPAGVTGGSFSTGMVTLTHPAPAGGATVSLTSDNAAATVPASVPVAAGATSGTFSVTTTAVTAAVTANITATYNGVSQSAALTISPMQTGASGNYDVTAGPINVDVTENTSGAATAATVVGLSPVNSFTGTVQLSVSGLPNGVSAVLSSPAVSLASGDASSNLTFTIASSTRPGFYAVDVRATSGSITRSAPVNLTVYPSAQAANFTVTEDVDGLEIAPGSSDIVSLAFSPNAGFSGTVNLSLQDDPAHPIINGTSSGIVATFNNSSVSSGSSTSTLTIQVGAQVAEATYNLLVKATSSTATQTLMLTIFVSPSNTGAGFGFPTTPPSSPQSPPSPLASSVSDMSRDDLDDSNNGQSPSGQVNSRADDLGINFDISELHASNIHPNYLGATDDRKPIGAFGPYSAVCRINAYGSNGGQGWVSTGTGFLVGRNHVLTAAHVLYDNSGHLATKVFVYPGYNNGASRTFHRASAKSKFIPTNYKTEVATGRDDTYDDWALIDLNPVVAATRADRGKALGDLAGYVYAEDDFVNPDVAATIPGYPGAAAGLQLNNNYMYYSAVYIGDDGPVMDHPPGNPNNSNADNLVYYTIDVSNGDSGAPIFRPDPVGNDNTWHAFAIVRAGGYGGTNFNDGTLISQTRKKIIQMLMQKDKDDISY